MDRPLALVVDHDPVARAQLREVLEARGVTGVEAASAPEALEALRTRPVGIVVVDLGAPGVSAAALVDVARKLRPAACVVVVCGEDAQAAAMSSVRAGAFDAQLKPLDPFRLELLAERAIRQSVLQLEHQRLREELRGRAGYDRWVGRSEVAARLRERLDRLAGSAANVMFEGETGAGKELAARILHSLSGWRDRPFVAVDCALPAPAVETELFGGGSGPAGLLLRDDGPVVYLDSVADLPRAVQERLAGHLEEERESRRARSGVLPPVLSSCKDDARGATERGRLHEPLWRQLATATVRVPALRERPEDIPILARHFIETVREINALPPIQLSPECLSVLGGYSWPGNVRELRNAVEQAVILAVDGVIRPRDLPAPIRAAEEPVPAAGSPRVFKEAKQEVVQTFERGYLLEILERHGGNVTSAAEQAGMLRSALQRLLRKHSIRSAEFRPRRDRSAR